MDLKGEEVTTLALLGAITGGLLAGFLILITLILELPSVLLIATAFLPIALYLSIGWYPNWRAEATRSKGAGEVPLLISYITVALKINPNLERAAKFSAKYAGKSLRRNLRDELWKACIRVNKDAKEALSKLGDRWKAEAKEFKRSIDLIKNSTSEKDEKVRKDMLDRALETSFEGVQNRMEDFAAGLRLPTTIIYGIGVLLPLILLAVLPVLSSTGIHVEGPELIVIYCLILPLAVYLLEKQTLANRPEAFPRAEIPSGGNRLRAFSASAPIILLPPIASLYFNLPSSIMALVMLWSLSSAIATFHYLSSVRAFRIRKVNRDLEEEFCDSVIQLGNRLKGGYPTEYVFEKTAENTEGSEISKILERTSSNLRSGGMDLRKALFDPEVGSLKGVYSKPVKNTFKILVDLTNRSSKAAGDAILHSGRHLKKLSDLETRIRRNFGEIVSSMRSVGLFFAPLVASITVQLNRDLSKNTEGIPLFVTGSQTSQGVFLSILGSYVIVLTILLTIYTVEIKLGDDNLMKRMEIARSLPVSMTVFTVGLIIGDQMLSFLTL